MDERTFTLSDSSTLLVRTWIPTPEVTDDGRHRLAYVITLNRHIIFRSDRFGTINSGCGGDWFATDDADFRIGTVLDWFSIQPGDTDAEYFDGYTPEQLAFAENYGEELSMEAMMLLRTEEGDERFSYYQGNLTEVGAK